MRDHEYIPLPPPYLFFFFSVVDLWFAPFTPSFSPVPYLFRCPLPFATKWYSGDDEADQSPSQSSSGRRSHTLGAPAPASSMWSDRQHHRPSTSRGSTDDTSYVYSPHVPSAATTAVAADSAFDSEPPSFLPNTSRRQLQLASSENSGPVFARQFSSSASSLPSSSDGAVAAAAAADSRVRDSPTSTSAHYADAQQRNVTLPPILSGSSAGASRGASAGFASGSGNRGHYGSVAGCFGGSFLPIVGGSGDGSSGNPKRRRMQRQYSWGEDDFEFLRGLMDDPTGGGGSGAYGTSSMSSGSGGGIRGGSVGHHHRQAASVRMARSSSPTSPSLFLPPPIDERGAQRSGDAVRTSFADSTAGISNSRVFSSSSSVDVSSGSVVTSARGTPGAVVSGVDRVGGGRGESGGSAQVDEGMARGEHEWMEVTREEKLRAADDVANLLWRADPRIRDRLVARVNDIWAAVEAEMQEVNEHASRGATASGGSSSSPVGRLSSQKGHAEAWENLSRRDTFPFRQILMNRLEATRQTIQNELDASDKATGSGAGYSGGGGGGATGHYRHQGHGSAPKWRGLTALRSDVLERLRSFQQASKDLKSAEILRAAENSSTTKNAAVREAMLRRLQLERTAMCHQARELRAQAIIDSDSNGGDGILDGSVADKIDEHTESLLQQLEENHKAAQRELKPVTDCDGVGIKQELLARLEATRSAAQAELLASEATVSNAAAGISPPATEGGAVSAATAAMSAASGAAVGVHGAGDRRGLDVFSRGHVGGGRSSARSTFGWNDYRGNSQSYLGASRGVGGDGGGSSAGEGNPVAAGAAADDGGLRGVAAAAGGRGSGGSGAGGRKRKRTSGGGRRCKHEGW